MRTLAIYYQPCHSFRDLSSNYEPLQDLCYPRIDIPTEDLNDAYRSMVIDFHEIQIVCQMTAKGSEHMFEMIFVLILRHIYSFGYIATKQDEFWVEGRCRPLKHF